jgi:CheY-like chemotaxis protein
VLIVEDTPERQGVLTSLYRDHAWVLVHTARRAISLLDAFDFDIVSLDFNLAGELTGADVARALAAKQLGRREPATVPCRVLIHSLNPRGAEQIHALLPDARVLPVSKVARSNAQIKRHRAGLLLQGAAYDFGQQGSGGKRDTLESGPGAGSERSSAG